MTTENPLPLLQSECKLDYRRPHCAHCYYKAQREADWERVKSLVKALEIIANIESYRDYAAAVPVRVRDIAQAALADWRKEND